MTIKSIIYASDFLNNIEDLPREIVDLAVKKEKILKESPFHPSLRLHPLKGRLRGLWSISVNMQYRIIFQLEDNNAVFISIGKHDIYKNL
ncbi:MAG TPA: type II toxin-antitoxin system mRNA interferase toxin, RelE/StbE family [Candidatus Pacearchaeota archaeon]|nr:type II toxin-antitoxin system mRNA interferase toxin, RelE/StbE family [Candidatus Pacearchaeota archaeon]HPR79655.1 type II toxin-antitoxin system mRNA interferase toxin, RelE/StbE family [Candidatus Pacearchaeota archaeon]